VSAIIRPMNWRRDHLAVLGFQQEIYETNFPGFRISAPFLHDYQQQLRQGLRSQMERLLVIEDEYGVGGFLWIALMATMVDPLVGYVKNIYVAPRLRRQGWGRRLLEEADQWFQSHGCPKAALDATIANDPAIKAYLQAGYEPERYRMEKRYAPGSATTEEVERDERR